MCLIMLEQYSKIDYEIFTVYPKWENNQISIWKDFIRDANSKIRPFTFNANFKNGKIINPKISGTIWNQIKPYLPTIYKDSNGIQWEFIGVTKHVMYAEILPDQPFPIHTDTGVEYSEKEQSKFTVLVYLNHDFQGGGTQFYSNSFIPTVEIIPESGKILVFDIDLFHAGIQVKNGNKYWIGTELVCRKI